ncbi:MAG: 50S ribosomal protein L6 [Desulfurococcales archaeon]|nr:50S ribosomal protein L6 [Desulfurococcales archaeon]
MAKDVHVEKRINVPDGVEVDIDGMRVTVRGPRGELSRDFSHARGIIVRKEGNEIIVEAYFADSRKRALVGSIASHINNMITGVTKGFRYKLKIIYSHFPMKVELNGDKLIISNFLGEKADRIAKILPGVTVEIKGQDIIVEGIDVESVGQTAANIEAATKIKDRDRRKFMDGIYIYEKGVAE